MLGFANVLDKSYHDRMILRPENFTFLVNFTLSYELLDYQCPVS